MHGVVMRLTQARPGDVLGHRAGAGVVTVEVVSAVTLLGPGGSSVRAVDYRPQGEAQNDSAYRILATDPADLDVWTRVLAGAMNRREAEGASWRLCSRPRAT